MLVEPPGKETNTRAVPPHDLHTVGALRAKHVLPRTDPRRYPGPGPPIPTLPCGSPPAASPRTPKRRPESCGTDRSQNLRHPGRRHRRTNTQRHPANRDLHHAAGLHPIKLNHGKGRGCRFRRLRSRLARRLPAPRKHLLWCQPVASFSAACLGARLLPHSSLVTRC